MSNRLGGFQGTAYLGTRANQPPNWTFSDRDPNQYDTQNVSLGDLWLNKSTQQSWILVSLAGTTSSKGSLATWLPFGFVTIETLTGNSGGAVSPLAGNINVVGDGTTITVVGDPLTSTLTISALGSGTVETLTGNSGGAVSPLAGNINVVGTGLVSVAGDPITHTLTISTPESVATTFTANDTSTATPIANNLNIFGSPTSILRTSASGNTITTNLVNGTNGQLIIGGGTNAAWANLTSTGGTVTITNGANSVNLETSIGVLKSAFLGYLNTGDIPNVTGDNTIYVLGTAPNLLTIAYDLNSDFDGSVFTAPVAGIYYLQAEMSFEKQPNFDLNQDAAQAHMVTTSVSYQADLISPVDAGSQSSIITFNISASANMDAGDTAYAWGAIGHGTKTIAIDGTAALVIETYFMGNIIFET